jgi:hypothetical protein
MLRRLFIAIAFACLLPLLAPAPAAVAQQAELQPRFGGGFDAILFVGNPRVVRDGLGLGVRGRVSFPINADFSLAADAGFYGFVLGGRDDALYVFNPQVAGIVTFPALGQARYLLGGLGWYAPLGSVPAEGGPAIHGGMGWVIPLRETSLYVEANPALVIGRARTALALPVRIGVIF